VLTGFDPDRHGEDPIVPEPAEVGDGGSVEPIDEGRMEFYLEAYLEEFLLTNWQLIDWGRRLRIWEGPNGESGHQFSTPVGRIDFLCIDEATNALVVVELKRGLPSDRVIGQAARYMGWARSELAESGQVVEGLIVTHESDERLQYAAAAISGLGLLLYEVTFELRRAQFSRGLERGA
jgi:restriction system protein